MKIGQSGAIFHQCLVHFQHLERSSEEVFLEEYGSGIDPRFLEHGEETVVLHLVETDGVAVHRRVDFGISPGLSALFRRTVLLFLNHIT